MVRSTRTIGQSTLDREKATNGSTPGQPVQPGRGGLRVAVSFALVVIGVAGGLLAYQHFDRRVAVLVLRHNVGQGQVIGAGDLQVARLAPTPGIGAVSAGAESAVVGRRASAGLAAGQLLVPADVSSGPTLAAGQVEIGAALGQTQVPAEGVVPGEKVAVVVGLTSAGSSKSASGQAPGSVLTPSAKVMAVSHPTSGGGAVEVVSLEVPAVQETAIEASAAAGEISLVPVPAGP